MSDPRKGLPSASDMDRIAHCPGCLQAEKHFSLKEDEKSFTKEGSDIAKALETGDTSELEESTEVIAQRLETMTQQAVKDWASRTGETDYEELREQRFWLADKNDNDLCSGQVDRCYVGKTHALILDHKSGYKEVDHSTKNKQLRTLAVCLQQTYPWIEEIQVAIAAFRFREQYTDAVYDRELLLQAQREIKLFLWRSKQPDAERVPGKWCDYCKAKADCAAATTRSLMPTVLVPDKPKPEDITAAVYRLTPKQLAFVEKRRTLADKVFKAVSQRIRNMSDADLAEAGLELKPQTITTVSQVGPALSALVNEGFLDKAKAPAACNVVMERLVDFCAPNMMKLRPDIYTSKSACAKAIADILSPFQSTAPKASRILVAKPDPKPQPKKETKKNERRTTGNSKRKSPKRRPKRASKTHRGDDGKPGD